MSQGQVKINLREYFMATQTLSYNNEGKFQGLNPLSHKGSTYNGLGKEQ